MYASSVTFFVNTPADANSSLYQNDQFGQKRINTYVQMISSDQLADMVVSASGVDLSPAQVEKKLTAKGDLNTVLLTATVTDTSPARSLALARAVSTQMVDLVAEFETPPGSNTSAVNLKVVSGPTLNPTPVSPRPVIDIGLGLVVGLLLGLVAAVLRDLLDTSIRSTTALAQVTKVPVLGVIPFDSSARRSPVLTDANARSVRAESFRRLRTNLQFVDVDSPVKVIALTSAVPGEGKSTTATNLAVTFAEMGKRVLVIEGDLRRPRLSQYFGLDSSVGLTNVVAGQVSLIEVLQPWGSASLMVLPSGSIPPNPSELLGSAAMIELIASARRTFDTVIIDTPPLLPVTDGAIVAAHTDGAVLVVRQGKTTRHQVTLALAALSSVDARVLGIVMNMARSSTDDRYASVYESEFKKPTTSELEKPKAKRGLRWSRSKSRSQPSTGGEVVAGESSVVGEPGLQPTDDETVDLDSSAVDESVDPFGGPPDGAGRADPADEVHAPEGRRLGAAAVDDVDESSSAEELQLHNTDRA